MLESELFALLEQTADAAYTVTDDGEIRSWNRAAERLLGYAASEMVGRYVDDALEARDALDTPVLAGGANSRIRKCDDTDCAPPNFDLHVRTRSGARLWVSVSTIVHHNRRSGRRLFIRLAHDIDQSRHNEELLGRLLEVTRQHVSLQNSTHHAPVDSLSDQEGRILKLLATGISSATIARNLGISAQTLRNHVHHINRKLRTHTRLEAVTHAQRRGLIA